MKVMTRRRRETSASVTLGGVLNPFPDAGSDPVGSTNYPIPATPATVRWVSLVALSPAEAAQSTYGRYTTMGAAHAAANPNDTIVIKGGVYHEGYVGAYKALTWQNAPNETVWLDGSYQVSAAGGNQNLNSTQFGGTTAAWANDTGAIYKKTGIFLSFSHALLNAGTDPAFPAGPYPEMVLYSTVASGVPRQMTQKLAKTGGTGLTAAGQFYYDPTAHILYVYGDPSSWDVYVANLQQSFDFPVAAVTMRGIGVRRFATSCNQFGTVRSQGAGTVYENCWFEDIALQGIFIQNTAQTVRSCTFRRCGKAGMTGSSANGSTIELCEFTNNNWERLDTANEAGGLKLSNCTDITFRWNTVDDNWGHGAWFDIACERVTAYGNRCRRNQYSGLFHEISSVSLFVGNLCTDNGYSGIHIGTSTDAVIWNNTCINNANAAIYFEDSARADSVAPTHVPINCDVKNNLLSGHARSVVHLQRLWDVRGTRVRVWYVDATPFTNPAGVTGVVGMNWTSDYNAYYRQSTGTTPGFATLVNGSGAVLTYNTLPIATTQDTHSILASAGASDAYVTCTEYTYTGDGPMSGTTCIDPTSTFAPKAPVLAAGTTLTTTIRDLLGIASVSTPDIGALQL